MTIEELYAELERTRAELAEVRREHAVALDAFHRCRIERDKAMAQGRADERADALAAITRMAEAPGVPGTPAGVSVLLVHAVIESGRHERAAGSRS